MEEFAARPHWSPARILYSCMSVPRTPHGVRGLAAPKNPIGVARGRHLRPLPPRQTTSCHESPPAPLRKACLDQQESLLVHMDSIGLPLSESMSPAVSRDHSPSSLWGAEGQATGEPPDQNPPEEELQRHRQVVQRLCHAKKREVKMLKYLATYKMYQPEAGDACDTAEERTQEHSATTPCTPPVQALRPRGRVAATSPEALVVTCGSTLSVSDDARAGEELGSLCRSPSGVLPKSQQSFIPSISAFPGRCGGGVKSTGSISAASSDKAEGRSSSCGAVPRIGPLRLSLPRLMVASAYPAPEGEPSRLARNAGPPAEEAGSGTSPPVTRAQDGQLSVPPIPVFLPCHRFVPEPSDAKPLAPAPPRMHALPSSYPRAYRARADCTRGSAGPAPPERVSVAWPARCHEPGSPTTIVIPPSHKARPTVADDAAPPRWPQPGHGGESGGLFGERWRPPSLRLGGAGYEAAASDDGGDGAGWEPLRPRGCHAPASREVSHSVGWGDAGISSTCRSLTPIPRSPPTAPAPHAVAPWAAGAVDPAAAAGRTARRPFAVTDSITPEARRPSTDITATGAGSVDALDGADHESSCVPRCRRAPLAEAFPGGFGAAPDPVVAEAAAAESSEADLRAESEAAELHSRSATAAPMPPSMEGTANLSLLLFDPPAFHLPCFRR